MYCYLTYYLPRAVIVGSFDAPESGGAGVGQPRAVAVAEEAEEAEDDVGSRRYRS